MIHQNHYPINPNTVSSDSMSGTEAGHTPDSYSEGSTRPDAADVWIDFSNASSSPALRQTGEPFHEAPSTNTPWIKDVLLQVTERAYVEQVLRARHEAESIGLRAKHAREVEAVQEALRDYFGTETMATVVEGALEDMAEETARDAGPKGMDRAEEINRTSDCRLLLKLVVLLVLFIVWILVIDFAGDVLIARIKAGRSVRREHRRESAGGMAIETLF